MKFSLCPRCELNYITEKEQYCKVCLQEMRGAPQAEEVELCSICNEMPVLPGKDVCALCEKEMSAGGSGTTRSTDDPENNVDSSAIGGMDSVSTMDEIIPEMEEEISNPEYNKLNHELSLESVREDEEKEQEENDDMGDGDER